MNKLQHEHAALMYSSSLEVRGQQADSLADYRMTSHQIAIKQVINKINNDPIPGCHLMPLLCQGKFLLPISLAHSLDH